MGYYDDMDDPNTPERHINIHFSPEIMAGVYANFANVSHSDYEFTITFARVDHEVEDDEIPGVVVSRINLSPKFMRELIDAMQDNYSKWQTREGIKNLPEFGEPPRRRSDRWGPVGPCWVCCGLRTRRASARSASAAPIRSVVGGWVASTVVTHRGGSRSATFWSAIARSNETNASGAPRQLERERVGAALDRARQPVGDQADRRRDDPGRQRQRGQRRRRAPLGAEQPAEPLDRERRRRGDDRREEHAARHVAVADVGELVGDDDAHLVAACSGRAACRTAPRASSVRARSRTRWRPSCGGSRRPSRPRRP